MLRLIAKACGKEHIAVLSVRYTCIDWEDMADNQKAGGGKFDASFVQTNRMFVFPATAGAHNVLSSGENLFQSLLRRLNQTSRRG
jgi:hypothetical protein